MSKENVNNAKLIEGKKKVEQTDARFPRLLGKINAKTPPEHPRPLKVRKTSPNLLSSKEQQHTHSKMDQYLAYLPQSEGFLPKWLFFVSSVSLSNPITSATPNP